MGLSLPWTSSKALISRTGNVIEISSVGWRNASRKHTGTRDWPREIKTSNQKSKSLSRGTTHSK